MAVFVPPHETPFTLGEAVPFLVVYVMCAVFIVWQVWKFCFGSYDEENQS